MKANSEIQKSEMVKVTLTCGRNLSSEAVYSGDGCGNCEDNTNNQTQATCC